MKKLCLPFFFFFLTNNYLQWAKESDRFIIKTYSDAYGYLRIAQAFPTVPRADFEIMFHHAKRLGVSYLIGGFH